MGMLVFVGCGCEGMLIFRFLGVHTVCLCKSLEASLLRDFLFYAHSVDTGNVVSGELWKNELVKKF